MTLVAAYWEYGDAVLFGDLLLSSQEKPNGSFHLPSVGYSDHLYTNGKYYNYGMGRKLHLFSGQLALGWTGSLGEASAAFKMAEDNFSGIGYFSRNDFFEFIPKLKQLDCLNLIIVGLFTDKEGTFTFKWSWDEPDKINIKGNYFKGSGQQYLLDKYNSISPYSYSEEGLPQDSSAILEAFKKCILLIGDEQVHGDTLQSYFGGGFELIVHDNGRLKLISDFAVVFWIIIYNDGVIENFYHKKNIIQQTYRDDILWIKANVYRGDDVDARYKNEWRTELYALQPINKNYNPDSILKIDPNDFNSKTICNYYCVEIEGQDDELVIVDVFNSLSTDFTFESNENEIVLTLSDEYITLLANKIKDKIISKLIPI